jgi:uncharacterized membrane protein YkoI
MKASRSFPRRHRALGALLTFAALTPATLLQSAVAHGGETQYHPKVSMAEARTKALGLVPGSISAEELEQEQGRWIYSFEIKPQGETRKIIKEVNIDADSGALVGDIQTERD